MKQEIGSLIVLPALASLVDQKNYYSPQGSRQVVSFFKLSEQRIGVSRILHDSMIVVKRHIPPEHREGPEAFVRDEEG